MKKDLGILGTIVSAIFKVEAKSDPTVESIDNKTFKFKMMILRKMNRHESFNFLLNKKDKISEVVKAIK